MLGGPVIGMRGDGDEEGATFRGLVFGGCLAAEKSLGPRTSGEPLALCEALAAMDAMDVGWGARG